VVRQQPSGRLVIDRAKVAAEERLDGKYLLSTSDPDLTAEDIALGHKNLLEAERGFRDLKSTLDLRPVYHNLEPRIRAHVLLCWLALLLVRVAERSTNLTWRRIAIELGRVMPSPSPAPPAASSTSPRSARPKPAFSPPARCPAPHSHHPHPGLTIPNGLRRRSRTGRAHGLIPPHPCSF
jgi:hypothetical protein